MYSVYKLNKQGDNIQPWCNPYLMWNQSVVPCPGLTVASWSAYRFLKRQVRWSGIPISFRIFQFVVVHRVKGSGIVNKAEIDIFLELYCFQMFKLVLEKAEELEIKLPTSVGSSKKQEGSRKTSISALLTMPKPLTVWITINCGKFFKTWEYQTTWPPSRETYMQVRKQQLEMDMEQQTGSK